MNSFLEIDINYYSFLILLLLLVVVVVIVVIKTVNNNIVINNIFITIKYAFLNKIFLLYSLGDLR